VLLVVVELPLAGLRGQVHAPVDNIPLDFLC
jgi:hypothetical protein